jgi:hypothetical protein
MKPAYVFFYHLGCIGWLLITLPVFVSAQHLSEPVSRDTLSRRNTWLIGTSSGGLILRAKDFDTQAKIKLTHLNFQPRIGLFVSHRWLLGLQGDYGFESGTGVQREAYYGVGYFARWYIPAWPSGAKHRFPIPPFVQTRFKGYAFLGHRVTNLYSALDSLVTLDRPEMHTFQVGIGGNIYLTRYLALEVTYLSTYIPQAPDRKWIALQPSVGLDLMLNHPPAVLSPIRKPRVRLPDTAPVAEADTVSDSGGFLRLGGSFTYIWQNEVGLYHERTLNLNAAWVFRERWSVGVSGMQLWTRSDLSGRNRYNLAGIFGQYDLFRDPDVRLFPEVGLYRGDYCTCGDLDPYRTPGNWYWSLGGGVVFPFGKRAAFELGFVNYQIFNQIADKYNFTQYILGLEYDLRRGKGK